MRLDKKHIAFFMALCLAAMLMIALSGCGKKAEPSPSTSAGMGVSSPSSNVDENKVYAKIIDRYKKALSGDSNESISSMGLNSSIYDVLGLDNSKFGYKLADLNDDGVKELIIGTDTKASSYKGMIFDLYTVRNGFPARLVSAGTNVKWYMCSDNQILGVGTDETTSEPYWHLCKADEKQSIVDGAEQNSTKYPNNPYVIYSKNKWTPSDAATVNAKGNELMKKVIAIDGITEFVKNPVAGDSGYSDYDYGYYTENTATPTPTPAAAQTPQPTAAPAPTTAPEPTPTAAPEPTAAPQPTT
ncbi:MAG: hypothetical protein IJG85_06635 [Eubacteriaceae bacterium]|nr:hypothetical protein [Eubacteriaceae bacterium]